MLLQKFSYFSYFSKVKLAVSLIPVEVEYLHPVGSKNCSPSFIVNGASCSNLVKSLSANNVAVINSFTLPHRTD